MRLLHRELSSVIYRNQPRLAVCCDVLQVTGIDIVQSQLRIAAGATLEELGLVQENIKVNGIAMQCRVTTENPAKDFSPDTG